MGKNNRLKTYAKNNTQQKDNTVTPVISGGQVYPHTNAGGGVMRAPEQTNAQFIFNEIVLRNIDRTPKTVGNWRDSHKAAESIYYPNRSRYLDLLADVVLDAHLSGIIDKRIKTTTNKTIRYVRDKQEDLNFKLLIESNEFNDMLYEALLSKAYGNTGFEFLPGADFCFKEIPRKHIKTEKKVIAINQTDYDGIPYEDLDNIWVIGKDRDLGYLLKAAFYVLLKKGNFSDWANFIEIYGQPMMVTKYDMFDEKTKIQLTNMMKEVGSSLRLSIPKQADFEVIDAKSSNGNGDLQKQFVDACNAEISVLILGATETTTSSKSSGFAQSKTQQQQQSEIIKDDIKFIRNLLNSKKFKTILSKMYGYDTSTGEFVIDEDDDVNDLLTRSQVDLAIKNGGVPIGDDYFYDNYNIPKPADYDTMKAQAETEEAEPEAEPAPAPGQPAKPGTTPAKKEKAQNLSDRIRNAIADFFVPPRR